MSDLVNDQQVNDHLTPLKERGFVRISANSPKFADELFNKLKKESDKDLNIVEDKSHGSDRIVERIVYRSDMKSYLLAQLEIERDKHERRADRDSRFIEILKSRNW